MAGTKRRLSFSGRPAKRKRSIKAYRRYRKTVRTQRRRNGVLGNSYSGTLKYVESVTVSSSAGLTSENIFRINGLQDPNVTGVGHQPYGHDTLATLYNRYRVNKVKYTITARPYGLLGGSMYAVVHDAQQTYVNNTPSTIYEQPHMQYKAIHADAPTTLKGTINLRKFFGVKRAEYLDDRFQSAFGSNPNEIAYLSFGQFFPSATTTYFEVYLKYYVTCMDPKMLPQS